ncbi:MAG: hypothetical protein SGILL_003943, partial [Bacillariaceae sp.]
MRKAFEEYIATTQDLEVNLDMELQDMRKSIPGKLDESAVAYETLTSQLKNMEPMLRKLEFSLGGTKKRLKDEAKRRRTAEIAQVEAETRYHQARDESQVWREECDTLRAEMEHKIRENDQLKREHDTSRRQLEELGNRLGTSIQNRREEKSEETNLLHVDSGVITEAASNKTSGMTMPGDEAYAEVLDELETVTEQLITTQQKLWRTEDLLRESESKALTFEGDIRRLKNKRDDQESEKSTLRELEQIRAELATTKIELEQSEGGRSKQNALREQEKELEEQDDRIELLRDQIEELDDNAKTTQDHISELEELLEESQEENIRLVEEIASLRIILQDEVTVQGTQSQMKESISKEVRSQVLKEANEAREKEINALREQFKKVFRENTALKEKIEKLDSGYLSTGRGGDIELKRKVEMLDAELSKVRDDHGKALVETEVAWKKKLEQVMTGEFIPEDLLEEMEEEMRTAIDAAADRVRVLQAEKEILESKVEDLERELEFAESKIHGSSERLQESESNLTASRDEILRLKKSNTHLTSELEYTTRIMSRMDAECERLTRQHSELKAELEVALQVIESGGMDNETVNTEETLKAKERANRLTSNLNKMKGDYSALLGELDTTRERFLNAEEKNAKEHQAEVNKLSERILQLEEALQRTELEHRDLSRRLQETREKQESDFVEKERAMKTYLQQELETAKKNLTDLENEMRDVAPDQKSLRKELKHCKDALSSSRIENQKLEEEIEKLKTVTDKNRSSMDPLAADELRGVPGFASSSSRDPPPATRNILDADDLRMKDIVDENEMLREKIIRLGSDKTSEEMKRVKGQLNAKIEQLRSLEDRFQDAQDLLEEAEKKLQHAERDLERAEDDSSDLRTEIATLKEALRDAHRIQSDTAHELERARREHASVATTFIKGVSDANSNGLRSPDLTTQLQKLSEEKSSLKHQLDDSKIALSVSEYSQERTKEELRTSQERLEKSYNDVRALKEELTKLARAFSELRSDHDNLL